MKILIDLTSLADNFSGIERFALSITKELIKHTDTEYILVFKTEVHEAFRGYRPNVKQLVLKGKNKLLFQQVILPTKLWLVKADYYIFLAFPAPFFFFSRKAISAIHDMGCWDCPETNRRSMIAYFRILYRKATMCHKKIITVSEFSKGRIVDILKVKPEDVWVIYNGISECFTDFRYDEKRDKKIRDILHLPKRYILCLSTIEPRKNMRLLIDAYAEMRDNEEIEHELVLVGRKGWMVDQLLEGISEDVKVHIHLTGFVGDDALPYVYKDASLFVFPSIYEGFGIPPVEALACGTPVLSSNAASMPEVLGDAVEYFKSGDKEALKRKLSRMLQRQSCLNGKIKQYRWCEEAEKLHLQLCKYLD